MGQAKAYDAGANFAANKPAEAPDNTAQAYKGHAGGRSLFPFKHSIHPDVIFPIESKYYQCPCNNFFLPGNLSPEVNR